MRGGVEWCDCEFADWGSAIVAVADHGAAGGQRDMATLSAACAWDACCDAMRCGAYQSANTRWDTCPIR
jgi:hypothetical protein